MSRKYPYEIHVNFVMLIGWRRKRRKWGDMKWHSTRPQLTQQRRAQYYNYKRSACLVATRYVVKLYHTIPHWVFLGQLLVRVLMWGQVGGRLSRRRVRQAFVGNAAEDFSRWTVSLPGCVLVWSRGFRRLSCGWTSCLFRMEDGIVQLYCEPAVFVLLRGRRGFLSAAPHPSSVRICNVGFLLPWVCVCGPTLV